jgi:hypothetical protein
MKKLALIAALLFAPSAFSQVLLTCANGGGISFTQSTGAGGGIGSIGWTLPSFMSASPGTLNAAGTQVFSFNPQATNLFLAGPASGSPAAPTFRGLAPADLPLFSSATAGAVPASGGGTTNFLRADGSFAAPPGAGMAYGGSVVSSIPFISSTTAPGALSDSPLTYDGANINNAAALYQNGGFFLNPTNTATSGANYPSRAMNEYVSYWNGSAAVSTNAQQYLWVGSGTNPAVIEDHYYPAGLTTISVLYAQNTANVATSGQNVNTPKYILRGATWTGTASQTDDWTFQGIEGTGANPTSTLTLSHAGSSGSALVSLPGLAVTGTPLIESGTASNSDIAGELSFSAVTTASYTFGNTYAIHPECWAREQFDRGSGNRMWITYSGATSMTINFAVAVTGNVSFGCVGRD